MPLYLHYSVFFLPTGTGTGTHSIGKSSVKIEQIGNLLSLYLQSIYKPKEHNKKYSCLHIVSSLSSTFFDNIYCCETRVFDLIPEVTILKFKISAAVDILECELGILSQNWEKPRFFGVGNGTVYRYQLYKEKKRCIIFLHTFFYYTFVPKD
jgi:hypothetical protein